MKIKKTYQGAVPLNRISNQENVSELNTYSTQYLNTKSTYIGFNEPGKEEQVWIQKGKNMFNHRDLLTVGWLEQHGTEFVFNDVFYYSEIKVKCQFKIGASYTASFNIKEQSMATTATVVVYYTDGSILEKNLDVYNTGRHFITFIPTKEVRDIDLRFFRLSNNTTSRTGKVDEIQIEHGDKMTEYEIYAEPVVYLRNAAGLYEPYIKNRVHIGYDRPLNGEEVWIQKSKNLFNIHNLTMVTGSVDNAAGIITVNSYSNQAKPVLRCLAPGLVAGKTYILSATTTCDQNYIYLAGSSSIWYFGVPRKLTQAELDNYILFYGWNNKDGITSTISQIQIEEGTWITEYEPYIENKIYLKDEKGQYINFYNDEVILYDKTSGSNATITLLDDASKYKDLEIIFNAEGVYNSMKVSRPNNKLISLDANVSFGDDNYIKVSKWEIVGNTIHLRTAHAYRLNASGISDFATNTCQVFITKVIGHK